MSSPSQHIEQHISEQLQQRLSPLQVRFVRLLEMNSSEAEEAVEKELADNPALERVEEETAQNLTEEGEVFGETAEDLQRKDYSDPDEIPYYRLRTPDSGHREEERPQVTPDYGDDLYSSLLAQLGELPISQETRELAEYIVGNLDPNGYLQRTPAGMVSDIAVATGREVSTEQMRRALQAVQSLDPPGVGASSLEESIRLQLERLQPSQRRDDALRIVAEAWDSFLKNTLTESPPG